MGRVEIRYQNTWMVKTCFPMAIPAIQKNSGFTIKMLGRYHALTWFNSFTNHPDMRVICSHNMKWFLFWLPDWVCQKKQNHTTLAIFKPRKCPGPHPCFILVKRTEFTNVENTPKKRIHHHWSKLDPLMLPPKTLEKPITSIYQKKTRNVEFQWPNKLQ